MLKKLCILTLVGNMAYAVPLSIESTVTTNVKALPINATTQVKTHKSVAKIKHNNRTKIANNLLLERKFDFQYIGDINGALYKLKEYDPNLDVLSSLGKSQAITVNIELIDVRLPDVLDTLNQQADDNVRVVYDSNKNTIRLVFNTTIDYGSSAVQESKRWQEGKNPRPVLSSDGLVLYPYGHYMPTLVAKPLTVSDIQFQPGEKIQGKPLLGDAVNWQILKSVSGDNIEHIVVKPTSVGLETNMLVNTNKRTYMIRMRSSQMGYVSRMGFFYPEQFIDEEQKANADVVNNSTRSKSKLTQTTSVNEQTASQDIVDPAKFDFNYKISGDDVPWKQIKVFNDGSHVYILFPATIKSTNLPTVMVYDNDSLVPPPNFSFANNMYIVDGLFEKALLISGVGDYQEQVQITYKKPSSSWFW